MFGKVLGIIWCLILFSGGSMEAGDMSDSLKDMSSFISNIVNSSYNLKPTERTPEATTPQRIHYVEGVYMLSGLLEYYMEKHPGLEMSVYSKLETDIDLSIKEILKRNYNCTKYSEYTPSEDVKLAHVLWLSQTINYKGEKLNSVYSGNCLWLIFNILKCQEDCSQQRAVAEAIGNDVRKVLKDCDIDVGQFE